MLAAAAAASLLWRAFGRFRDGNPERAENVSNNVQSAAVMIGAAAQVVSILLKALWGSPSSSPATIGVRRIGEVVGEGV